MSKRNLNRLSHRQLARQLPKGRYSDGGGLSLVISASGLRKWVFRYSRAGVTRDMGLGAAGGVSLAEAREAAITARSHLREGRDPIAERHNLWTGPRNIPTFAQVADELIASIGPSFRNAKHRAQWRMTLDVYAKPLHSKPVDSITTDEVLAVLTPLWNTKPETASRLRGRIERVLDVAKAKGLRSADNPARWRGHLATILPSRHKLSRRHFSALPYDEIPVFLEKLRAVPGVAARALEFLILTASRSGEVRQMTWRELNEDMTIWTVPADRMKGAREHRVPLSHHASQILRALPTRTSGYVFCGRSFHAPQSNMALAMLVRRLHAGITVHGFRSTFRDWSGEVTSFPREIAEAALAHVIGDQTERAYRRGDALDKRRELMTAWSNYCASATGNIIQLQSAHIRR